MSPLTSFLSKLLGLYCILVGLALMVRKEATLETVNVLLHNAPLLYVLGVITLLMGLAMVLGHNVWSGGLLPVIVTLIGWLALIKGALFLFLSPLQAVGLYWGRFHYQRFFYVYGAISVVLGVYLTYGGFKSAKR